MDHGVFSAADNEIETIGPSAVGRLRFNSSRITVPEDVVDPVACTTERGAADGSTWDHFMTS
jgi:hypothetical protein